MSNLTVIKSPKQNSSKIVNRDSIPEHLLTFSRSKEDISSGSKRRINFVLKEFMTIYHSNYTSIEYLSKEHFNSFKISLESKVNGGYIKISTAQGYLNVINALSRHLFKYNQISFIYNESFIRKSTKTRSTIPRIVNSFLEDLTAQNYSQIYTYKKNIIYFFNFLYQEHKEFDQPELLQESDLKRLSKNHIESYHNFLSRRVALEEITLSRALNLLRCLKLFLLYYRRLNIISFKYGIPEKFQTQHNRSNEYVPTMETLRIIDAIIDHSRFPERNLSIFLIILDTGCRPIEIVNMELSDVLVTESAVILKSKKSGQRKLKLNKKVMDVVKMYLRIRKQLSYSGNSLFLSSNNKQLTINVISHIYASANKQVYGKILYTAKSYRHAYATNALENKNNFDNVSKSMGHLHWISTQYYLEKSIERLKRNTLNTNPVNFL